MAEYPEDTGNTLVTLMNEGDHKVFRFSPVGAVEVADTITWTISDPVRLERMYFYSGIPEVPAYTKAELSVTFPDGTSGMIARSIVTDNTLPENSSRVQDIDMNFPVGTQFSLLYFMWAYNDIASFVWLNFRYFTRDIGYGAGEQMQKCGTLGWLRGACG